MKSFKISVDEVDRFDEQIKFIMEIQNEKRKVKAVTVDKKIIVSFFFDAFRNQF